MRTEIARSEAGSGREDSVADRGTPSTLDLVLVGPVAPPLGGVSTHVERLARLLGRDGLSVGILNHFADCRNPLVIGALRRNPARYWWEMRRLHASVVHYHHARWSTLMAAALARGRGSGAWVITVHGHELEPYLRSRRPGVARLTRWAMRRFDRVIAVSDAVADYVLELTGIRPSVIPAYLPADVAAGGGDDGDRPPTVVVSAYKVGRAPSSDLYGLDVAGAVYAAAAAAMPNLHLEIFLAQAPRGADARRYLDQSLQPARRVGGAERVNVHVGEALAPAFRDRSVYLRPTRTDGDAVSIREAMDATVPVIASDAVPRPPGVVTVPLDAIDRWVAAISRALDERPPAVDRRQSSMEHAHTVLLLYRELVS